MRRLKTHFEQIPVEIVKKIIEAEVAEKTAGSSAESEEGRLRI
jgi:hypothetical protein